MLKSRDFIECYDFSPCSFFIFLLLIEGCGGAVISASESSISDCQGQTYMNQYIAEWVMYHYTEPFVPWALHCVASLFPGTRQVRLLLSMVTLSRASRHNDETRIETGRRGVVWKGNLDEQWNFGLRKMTWKRRQRPKYGNLILILISDFNGPISRLARIKGALSVCTTMTPYPVPACLCGVGSGWEQCGEVECRVPENPKSSVRHLNKASAKNFSHRMKFQSGND